MRHTINYRQSMVPVGYGARRLVAGSCSGLGLLDISKQRPRSSSYTEWGELHRKQHSRPSPCFHPASRPCGTLLYSFLPVYFPCRSVRTRNGSPSSLRPTPLGSSFPSMGSGTLPWLHLRTSMRTRPGPESFLRSCRSRCRPATMTSSSTPSFVTLSAGSSTSDK